MRFVLGPSTKLFAACKCVLFSPECLQAGAVKGLIQMFPVNPLTRSREILRLRRQRARRTVIIIKLKFITQGEHSDNRTLSITSTGNRRNRPIDVFSSGPPIPPRAVENRRSKWTEQSSGAAGKSRWPSWAPAHNKSTVSVDVGQHSTNKWTEQNKT